MFGGLLAIIEAWVDRVVDFQGAFSDHLNSRSQERPDDIHCDSDRADPGLVHDVYGLLKQVVELIDHGS